MNPSPLVPDSLHIDMEVFVHKRMGRSQYMSYQRDRHIREQEEHEDKQN